MTQSIHYIYKITNILTGRIYIGKHKTKDLDDGYFGSGSYLNIAIDEWGFENFKKDIICYCSSEKEMRDIERSLINANEKAGVKTYNIQKNYKKLSVIKVNGKDGRKNDIVPTRSWYLVTQKEMKACGFSERTSKGAYARWFETLGYRKETIEVPYTDGSKRTKKVTVVYKTDEALTEARRFLT